MRDVQAVDYSVKAAKRIAMLWGIVVVCGFLNMAVALMIPGLHWRIVAMQAFTLCVGVVMLRYALIKLSRAKNNEWVRSMFEEWSR